MTAETSTETLPATDPKPIRRALLSVTDKTGLVEFARVLERHGVELVSTGGTATALREAGLLVRDVAELTGFPEMLDGRVKTLHPRVHGGLLHVRADAEHVRTVLEHGIEPIDLLVVNLYAFESTAARPGVTTAQLIENIDIGGPAMIRSGAKNFEDVAVVTGVGQYDEVASELEAQGGALGRETRWRLAKAAFGATAAYDAAIATTLDALPGAGVAAAELPATLRLSRPRATTLRYGENPHQRAALYTDGSGRGIAAARQLQGKELSYNNLVDLDACWQLVAEFARGAEAAVAIVKHTNPCGVATGRTVAEAYVRALEADPVSAFGGVIGCGREVDGAAAEEIAKLFAEAIVAPSFTEEARQRLQSKKNLRVLEIEAAAPARLLKQVSGGFLLQDADEHHLDSQALTVPTKRRPTAEEMQALLFAWKVTKHVKSNAIVYARAIEADGGAVFAQTVGIGAGQMSRVDAARFGAMKAALPLAGTVAASDAFFPFADGLEVVAGAGATAVIQPGGSVRDAEVIEAADRLGVAMVFTGVRHFRHG